jgi:hypothetical protein
MKQRIAAAAVLLFLLGGLPARSLFAMDIQFPLALAFVHFPFLEQETLKNSRWQMSFVICHSNIYAFRQDMTIVNDMELLHPTLSLRYRWNDRFTIEAYAGCKYICGGTLDRTIENFHTLFGYPDSGRPQFPRNSVHYSFKDYFSLEKDTLVPSPLVIGLQWELFRSGGFFANTRAAIGLPLSAQPGLSSDRAFLTLGVGGGFANNGYQVLLNQYVAFFRAPSWLPAEEVRPRMLQGELQFWFKHFTCGILYRTSPLTYLENGEVGCSVYFGWRIPGGGELRLVEDFGPMTTSADIGSYFSWNWHIGTAEKD